MKSICSSPGLIILLLISFAIVSCKKQEIQQAVQPGTAKLQNVIDWLDAQKLAATNSGKAAIAALKTKLTGAELRVEKFNDGENLIIIPLQNTFKTINITDNKSFKQLVLVENETGKLRRGDIIEILPKDQSLENISDGLVSGIYNNKPNNFDGIFSISSITNKLTYELTFTKVKIASTKYVALKTTGNTVTNNAGRVQGCTAYYLVTTTYYDDGSTDESKEYLYTSCDNCNMERIMTGNTIFKVNCDGGGGGGGENYENVVTIEDVIKMLRDKCLLNVVNVVGTPEFKNQIVKLYNETYTGNAQQANIRFQENSTIRNQDGSPRSSESTVEPPGVFYPSLMEYQRQMPLPWLWVALMRF